MFLKKNRFLSFALAPVMATAVALGGVSYLMQEGDRSIAPHGLPHIEQGPELVVQTQELDRMKAEMLSMQRKLRTGQDMHELLHGAPAGTQEAVAANLGALNKALNTTADRYATSLLTRKGISEWQYKDYAGFLKINSLTTSFNIDAASAPYLNYCQRREDGFRASVSTAHPRDDIPQKIAACMEKKSKKKIDDLQANILFPAIFLSLFPAMFLLVGTESSLKRNGRNIPTWQSVWINRLRREEKSPQDIYLESSWGRRYGLEKNPLEHYIAAAVPAKAEKPPFTGPKPHIRLKAKT
jgi:hypothetical protein